jgi:carbonic anhydrase
VILVLGHKNCGAVDAVIHGKTKDIESVAKLIKPAVEQARKAAPFDLLSLAVKLNAIRMRDYLLASKILKKLVADKKIEIHAGYYQLRTGEVEIL